MMRNFFLISCTFLVLISPLHPVQSFSHDKQAMAPADIACLLSPGEKVLWAGKPATSPLILKLVTSTLLTLLVGFISYKLSPTSMSREERWMATLFSLFFPIGWGVSVLFTLANALNSDYVITNNGLFLKLGLLESDTKIIKWSNIENIELRRGFLENLLFKNIGSIYIDTGETETYDVVQKNETVKKIKKRHGRQMIEDEIHEKQGPDIIREKTRKKYYILVSIPHYTEVYRLLKQTMKEASK